MCRPGWCTSVSVECKELSALAAKGGEGQLCRRRVVLLCKLPHRNNLQEGKRRAELCLDSVRCICCALVPCKVVCTAFQLLCGLQQRCSVYSAQPLLRTAVAILSQGCSGSSSRCRGGSKSCCTVATIWVYDDGGSACAAAWWRLRRHTGGLWHL